MRSKSKSKEETNGAFSNVLEQRSLAPCWQLVTLAFVVILTERHLKANIQLRITIKVELDIIQMFFLFLLFVHMAIKHPHRGVAQNSCPFVIQR